MSVTVFETLQVYQNGVLAFTCQNDPAALATGLATLPNQDNILINRVVENHSIQGGSGFPNYTMPTPQKHANVKATLKNHQHYSL